MSETTKNRKLDYLLVATYGRSGSTLLQGILNSSPQIHITGENGDFMYSIFKAVETLRRIKSKVRKNNSRDSRDPHFGTDFFSSTELISQIEEYLKKQIVKSNNDGTPLEVIGWKEIRYPYRDDLHQYLDFLKEALPNLKVIFLFRNLENVMNSGMFAEMEENKKETAKKKFMKFENSATEYAKSHSHCIILRYDDMIGTPEYVWSKLNNFGIPVEPEKVKATMKIPHSYTWKADNIL